MVLGNGNGKGKHWIQSSDSLLNGKVTYAVKFLGKAEVEEPRGMPMVKNALQKLSFTRQIKRSEGAKPPKVELGINVSAVTISDVKTKETLHNIPLHRVSFCADDKTDKRLFAFIAKLDDDRHYCYGLDSLHQANDITLTIGQAFELAYEKFLKENPPSQSQKKLVEMSKRVQELETENNKLRKRIAELEAASRPSSNPTSTKHNQVSVERGTASPFNFSPASFAVPQTSNPESNQEAIDAFNMQPFSPRLPQPPKNSQTIPANPLAIDPFNPILEPTRTSKEFLEMQNAFSKGLAVSEDGVTLDSFDPLKH